MVNFIILAAGRGSRLKEVSNHKPKALFNFLGKPLLKYQLYVLQKYNRIKKFLVTGYKAELFLEYKIFFEKIFNNKYFLKTNMVYSLFLAKKKVKNDVVIVYGDVIFDNKVYKLLKYKKNVLPVNINWFDNWKKRMPMKKILNDAKN